jgi:hypothetical protein
VPATLKEAADLGKVGRLECFSRYPDGPVITFPLSNDNMIEIRLRKPVSEKDFKRIQQLVELSKDSRVEAT